ncbi:MAG: nicotinate-nucleotide--dimethylbenzimidazole phosphoribosyltransferase [Actinobacteria bacterium]|nr:nicotinate-nucleotide--dimethylbenzimidazole phosphoribosyltransferase [Actinomycetota bacterium]
MRGDRHALDALRAAIDPIDDDARRAALARHATLVKPPGSLGRLEQLGAQLAGIAGRCPPPVPESPAVVIAAADHGVHAHGVTPWPQEITRQMVRLFCAGQAGVNAVARTVGATVAVLDVGCADPPPAHPLLRSDRVRAGTADLTTAPAMSRTDAIRAVCAGATMASDLIADGADLLVTGDMGIANTTASACLIAAFTGADAGQVTGPGAGATEDALAHKTAVVRRALDRHRPDPADPLGVLATVGGLEHAALVGVLLAGARLRVPVLLDGVITNAAALCAAAWCPAVTGHLIAGHRSPEPGATVALDHLRLAPLYDLRLRLGEGTGGLLAVPLAQAAARTLREMAVLDELAVDGFS